MGCFADLVTSTYGRDLSGASLDNSNNIMTVDMCISFCANYSFAGVQYK